MKMVVVEGASTAYGWHDEQHGGWAHRLRMETGPYNMRHPDKPVVIDNRALPGLTIAAITRAFGMGTLRFKDLENCTSVLSVGINEPKIMSGATRPIIGLDQFADHLKQYGNIAARLGMSTVYVGPQPYLEEVSVSPRSGGVVERDLVEEYASVIEEAASQRGMPYVDTFELFAHNLEAVTSADERHPNALGHAIMYGAISDALHSLGALER